VGRGNVTVLMNGQEVGRVTHPDDASVRRAANRSGFMRALSSSFPARPLVPGKNNREPANGEPVGRRTNHPKLAQPAPGEAPPTGQMPGSSMNNGIMYDTIVLETD